MFGGRFLHSLCSSQKDSIYATGGVQGGSCLDTVSRYDILNDTWSPVAKLNVARQGHASCATAETVYVFCGFSSDETQLASIELLDLRAGIYAARWQLLDVSKSSELTPRFGLGVANLNTD